jgi:hypothetical protein
MEEPKFWYIYIYKKIKNYTIFYFKNYYFKYILSIISAIILTYLLFKIKFKIYFLSLWIVVFICFDKIHLYPHVYSYLFFTFIFWWNKCVFLFLSINHVLRIWWLILIGFWIYFRWIIKIAKAYSSKLQTYHILTYLSFFWQNIFTYLIK